MSEPLDKLRAMFYPQRFGPETDFDRGVDAVLNAIEYNPHLFASTPTLDLDSPETVERAVWNIDADGIPRSSEWWQGYEAAQRPETVERLAAAIRANGFEVRPTQGQWLSPTEKREPTVLREILAITAANGGDR